LSGVRTKCGNLVRGRKNGQFWSDRVAVGSVCLDIYLAASKEGGKKGEPREARFSA